MGCLIPLDYSRGVRAFRPSFRIPFPWPEMQKFVSSSDFHYLLRICSVWTRIPYLQVFQFGYAKSTEGNAVGKFLLMTRQQSNISHPDEDLSGYPFCV